MKRHLIETKNEMTLDRNEINLKRNLTKTTLYRNDNRSKQHLIKITFDKKDLFLYVSAIKQSFCYCKLDS